MTSAGRLESLLRRDRQVVVAVLAIVIAGCWLYLLAGAGMSDAGMATAPAEWTVSHSLVMFVMWWLMMIAMMLPSAAPMVLLHATVLRKGHSHEGEAPVMVDSGRTLTSTGSFVAGYLVAWGGFSLVAVVAQRMLERQQLLSNMMSSSSVFLSAGLLLTAGMWQLTPVKTICLRHCRSPIGFVSAHWRPGVRGAFEMGIRHGAYCLGCCWLLMALLFFGGVMNLIWVAGLALFVLLEKFLPGGDRFGRVVGIVLFVWGAWLVLKSV